MKITICCEDEKLMQKLKKQVNAYFFPIQKNHLISLTEEEMTTKIHTKDNCYYIRSKLNELEDALAEYPALIRCHMSFFVNCNYAVTFGNKKFELKNGEIIPVRRKYYQSVKEYVMHSNALD